MVGGLVALTATGELDGSLAVGAIMTVASGWGLVKANQRRRNRGDDGTGGQSDG